VQLEGKVDYTLGFYRSWTPQVHSSVPTRDPNLGYQRQVKKIPAKESIVGYISCILWYPSWDTCPSRHRHSFFCKLPYSHHTTTNPNLICFSRTMNCGGESRTLLLFNNNGHPTLRTYINNYWGDKIFARAYPRCVFGEASEQMKCVSDN
jgi:hypothetical protein